MTTIQTPTVDSLRADIARLQKEAIAVHSRAATGDKAAQTRRTELMTAIQFAQVQLADLLAAEEAARGDQVLERARDAVEASQEITQAVRNALDQRIELAKEASIRVMELGNMVRQLIQLHRGGGNIVRRSLPVEASLVLDTDDLAPVRAVLSTFFNLAGVEPDEAMRSLQTLNFGIQRQTEDVQQSVANQNDFLLSLRGQWDQRAADRLADLEAQREVA